MSDLSASHPAGRSRDPAPDSVEVTEIVDPAVPNTPADVLEQDLVPLTATSSLRARQSVVRVDDLVVVHYETNLRVRTRPTLGDSVVAVVTFGAGSRGSVNGLTVRDGLLVVVPPGRGLSVVAEAGYRSASFMVPAKDFDARLGGLPSPPPWGDDVAFLDVPADEARALYDWCSALLGLTRAQPDILDGSPRRRSAAKDDLLERLLVALSSSSTATLARRERTRTSQSEVVRLAERHALEHAGSRVYVSDLCRAAGVSERTLEYAFRDELGLRPSAYLTRLRLHRVHAALLHGTPTETSVTEEALKWGFWHFGEFARAYRECFDELPSDTLRRSTKD